MIISNLLYGWLILHQPCDVASMTGLIFETDMLFHTDRHTMLHAALLAHRYIHALP